MLDYNFKKPYHWGNQADYKNNVESTIDNEKDMNESDIRLILSEHLKKEGYETIAERNDVSRNSNPFDLVSGDSSQLELTGFEIKGDRDNFKLLKEQLKIYKAIFDKSYIVLHKKSTPEWLPENIGVIRVFENGDIYEEVSCYIRDEYDIGSDYEWDTLLKANGLGVSSKRTKEVLELIKGVRRNILYNRFFGVLNPEIRSYDTKKIYSLNDKQKELLIGFDVPYHYNLIDKDIKMIEKRISTIKKICNIGDQNETS